MAAKDNTALYVIGGVVVVGGIVALMGTGGVAIYFLTRKANQPTTGAGRGYVSTAQVAANPKYSNISPAVAYSKSPVNKGAWLQSGPGKGGYQAPAWNADGTEGSSKAADGAKKLLKSSLTGVGALIGGGPGAVVGGILGGVLDWF